MLRLILSSLRYWVSEMHVDGFRFDLAAILARQEGNLEKFAAFLDLVYQDPVVSQVKLIAEPWDANGGYVLGQFPPPWAQWNDHYRANVRDYWRAQAGIGDLATRLAGSHDVFARRSVARVFCQHRYLPRRFHAERPGVLQRQAQCGQRRQQQ